MKVIVVGAGLAGLTCARMLREHDVDVHLFEASDGVGGRVRTDVVDGFRLDRGFQVLFTSYPALHRHLDLNKLDLRRFDPGAIVAGRTRRYVLSDPLRDPSSALQSAVSPVVTAKDKVLTAMLALQLRMKSIDRMLEGADTTTEKYLREYGFSSAYIDRFVRPFYGGIFLDRTLRTSAKCFKFDFKMLTEGYAAIPAGGIGQVALQIAERLLAEERISLNMPVHSLLRSELGRVKGVALNSGEEREADIVVLSVPAPEAARLTGLPMPQEHVGTVNLYWQGDVPVYRGKKIVLNASSRAFVNNASLITNVAPEYAPPGKHLLSATVLGVPSMSDSDLFSHALLDIRRMFNGDGAAQIALGSYEPIRLYRISYAQFAQPPAIHPGLPDNDSAVPGLIFASEFTEASSQNAAMISAEKAVAFLGATL